MIEEWSKSEPDVSNASPSYAWEADQHYLILYENAIPVAESCGSCDRGLRFRFVLAARKKRENLLPECMITHERFSTGPSSIGLFTPEAHINLGFAGKFSTTERFFAKAHSILIDKFNIITVESVTEKRLSELGSVKGPVNW